MHQNDHLISNQVHLLASHAQWLNTTQPYKYMPTISDGAMYRFQTANKISLVFYGEEQLHRFHFQCPLYTVKSLNSKIFALGSNLHGSLSITLYLVSTSQLVYVNLGLKSRHAVCRHKANGLQPFLAKNVVETDICICQIHGWSRM